MESGGWMEARARDWLPLLVPPLTDPSACRRSLILCCSPAKEGWLEKQSRHLKRWKRRSEERQGHA